QCFFLFQAEDGIRDRNVTGVQTCALPIYEVIAEMVDGSLVMKGILEQENSVAKMQVGTAFASTVSPGVAWFDVAGTGKYAGIGAQGGSSGNASVVVQGPRSTSTGGDEPYGYMSVTEESSVLTYRAAGDNGQ